MNEEETKHQQIKDENNNLINDKTQVKNQDNIKNKNINKTLMPTKKSKIIYDKEDTLKGKFGILISKIDKNFIFTKRRIKIFFAILIILILPTLIFGKYMTDFFNGKFRNQTIDYGDFVVYFVDVGQGDCSIIKFPDGKIMVIDCGDSNIKSCNQVMNTLKKICKNNIIDYFILTHGDSDHCGAIFEIFNTYKVINFYRPLISTQNENFLNFKDDSLNYKKIIDEAKEHCKNVFFGKVGTYFVGEDYKFKFISPYEDFEYNNSNDASSVIMVTCFNKTFLFTADIGKYTENTLITNTPLTDIEILKVAHHGSKNSTSKDFLKIFNPKYAVISCEKDNTYGFPSSQVITNLTYYTGKENIFCTSTSGDVIFSYKNDNLKIYQGIENLKYKVKVEYFVVFYILVASLCFVRFRPKEVKYFKY